MKGGSKEFLTDAEIRQFRKKIIDTVPKLTITAWCKREGVRYNLFIQEICGHRNTMNAHHVECARRFIRSKKKRKKLIDKRR